MRLVDFKETLFQRQNHLGRIIARSAAQAHLGWHISKHHVTTSMTVNVFYAFVNVLRAAQKLQIFSVIVFSQFILVQESLKLRSKLKYGCLDDTAGFPFVPRPFAASILQSLARKGALQFPSTLWLARSR